MVTVTKEYTWDCAHMLSGHEGLCKNVHGHTYKMEVEVEHFGASELVQSGPAEGMVIDFKELRDVVKVALVDKLDHAYVTSKKAAGGEREIAELIESLGMRVYHMPNRPTAENMAEHFAEVIHEGITNNRLSIKLVRVTVWETPTSYATWKL